MNDAIESIGGDIITDNQPFTQEYYNQYWLAESAIISGKPGVCAAQEAIHQCRQFLSVFANFDPASWTSA